MASIISRFYTRPAAMIAVFASMVALVVALVQTGVVGASQETVLTLVPVGETRAGALITVKLVARNARDLAGFQGAVQFDPTNLRLTGSSVENEIGRNGRGVLPLGPVASDNGVVLGAATCPSSDCGSGNLQFSQRVENGVNGGVELGTLEFYSTVPGRYNLGIENVKFVDPQGNLLDVRAESLVLEVTE